MCLYNKYKRKYLYYIFEWNKFRINLCLPNILTLLAFWHFQNWNFLLAQQILGLLLTQFPSSDSQTERDDVRMLSIFFLNTGSSQYPGNPEQIKLIQFSIPNLGVLCLVKSSSSFLHVELNIEIYKLLLLLLLTFYYRMLVIVKNIKLLKFIHIYALYVQLCFEFVERFLE